MSKFNLNPDMALKGKVPIVSVNIPIYNCKSYLKEAIESILNQTFQDFELILCNDGSTDNSLEIAQSFAAKDSRIMVISRRNLGIVATRNELLANSRGKFIAVLDCDDVALPNRLALQVQYLEEHPEVVCVGGDSRLIDNKGRYLTTLVHIRGNEAINESALAGNGAITQSCAMIRTDVLRKIGGYDPECNFAEDLDIWLRLGECGKLENIAEPVSNYRLNDGSVSELNGLKQRQVAKLACEAAAKRRGIASQYNADGLWRPGSDANSKHKFMLQYGWWAWINKEYKTAAIYGIKAIMLKVQNMDGWKLLACALLKRN